MMTPTEREAWLQERLDHITASEVACLWDANPFKTRKQLLAEKVERKLGPSLDGLPWIMAGQYFEPGVLGWHCAHRGFPFPGSWSGGLVEHPSFPPLAATPDALVVDDVGPCMTEIKTTELDKLSKWQVRDDRTEPVETVIHAAKSRLPAATKLRAPRHYWMQLQTQMACLNLDRGRVVVAFGNQARADLLYLRDRAFESELLRRAESFWAEVLDGRARRGTKARQEPAMPGEDVDVW